MMEKGLMTEAVIDVAALGKVVPSGDGTLTILHEISFAVTAGEAVAIVGASGSGKSTLLGLMAGLDLPSSGTVHLGGQDLAALDEDARAELRGRLLGFVFQSFQLLPALTALENTMLPLELAGRAMRARSPRPCWRGSASASGSGITRSTCPAASSSAWRWRAPSPCGRNCCWPTSRPATSMPPPARRSST
jgi:ABC-type sugar transport system ATPase subunit